MSWQLAATVVLGLALAGGFAWYERSHPDARVVALVATLAAFAALGRIAFVAVPNVKPTTDIVLLSGYALGPAPGFMVGAAAGLTSNFFFGQGPWTPWQMVGWGMTGLIGAGLAGLTAGRIRRWPLALTCMVVGFGFTALQDVGDWVNFSDHSLAQLGVYVGKGVGFDGVHAAGCLIFALAFGPALTRSLARFATRLNVTWRTAGGVIAPLLLAVFVVGGGVGVAHAGGSPSTYLRSAQNRDGGFGPAPGQASTQLFSGWAALGLAAEGYSASRVERGGHSLLAYLRSTAGGDSDPGALERSILAAVAAGADPRRFGGRDLVSNLERAIGRDGAVSDQSNLTSFAVLALRAAGSGPYPRTLAWLIGQQDRDGGFNYATAGAASDIDDTGAALEALAGDNGPAASRVRRRAIRFITAHQNRDGGFPSSPGDPSNAQSTAWAVQGLVAAGMDPAGLHRGGAASPLAYLRSLIAADGHIRYSRSSDQTPVWVTAEAVMALRGKVLPLAAVPPPRVAQAPKHPRAAQHRIQVHPHRRGGRGRSVKARPASRASAVGASLATDAGILDALALAPIGIG
jgi:energy-coupling factor transport system substrate-specific component